MNYKILFLLLGILSMLTLAYATYYPSGMGSLVDFPANINLQSPYNVTATNFNGNLSWSYLTDYPIACPTGSAITQLGDSVTCTALNGSGSFVPFDGATSNIDINNKTISGATAIFNGTNSLYSQGNSFFGTATQNIVIGLLNLGGAGTYGLLGGNSDGAFGNIFAVSDALILYDSSADNSSSLIFTANDVSNIARIDYDFVTSTITLADGLGSDGRNLVVTGNATINANLIVEGCLIYNNTGTPVTLGDCI